MKSILNAIEQWRFKAGRWNRVPVNAEIYTTDDLVLHMLEIGNPCPITIEMDENVITLSVAGRDWRWNRKTGELTDTGATIPRDLSGEGK